MKKEKEDLLKSILESPKKSIQYSNNAIKRFLERISSKDERIKQLVISYLSCQSLREQEVFIDAIPKHDKDSFSIALQEIATWSPSGVSVQQS
jgi:hypothetical protein